VAGVPAGALPFFFFFFLTKNNDYCFTKQQQHINSKDITTVEDHLTTSPLNLYFRAKVVPTSELAKQPIRHQGHFITSPFNFSYFGTLLTQLIAIHSSRHPLDLRRPYDHIPDSSCRPTPFNQAPGETSQRSPRPLLRPAPPYRLLQATLGHVSDLESRWARQGLVEPLVELIHEFH